MPTCSGKTYTLDTKALHQHLIGKCLMEGSTKYHKVWFRLRNKFMKGRK